MTASSSTRPRAAVVGALLAMYATSPGQTYVVSGFNESLRAGVDAGGLGLTATQLSGSYLVGTLLSASCLTHAGKVADRIGPRRMIALAGLGLAGAGAFFSSVSTVVMLTAAFFGLRFFGQGVMSLASSHALALRFDRRLGSVEGLRGAVVSLAIATAPLIAVTAIQTYGWRAAAWRLTAGAGLLAVIAAYGIMDRDPAPDAEVPADERTDEKADESAGPAHAGASFSLPEARRTRSFWTLVGCTAFTAGLITAIHFHLQPLLAARGMDEAAAAKTFVPFALAGLVSTLTGGVLVDRLAAGPLLAAAMVMLGCGAAALGLTDGHLAAHVGMGLVGVGHGLATAVGGPTLARFFGRAHHGAIRGASGTAAVAGSAAGPYVLSAVADGPAGSFGPAVLALAALALPIAWIAFRLRRPSASA